MNTDDALCRSLARSADERLRSPLLGRRALPWHLPAYRRGLCRPEGHSILTHVSRGTAAMFITVFLVGVIGALVGILTLLIEPLNGTILVLVGSLFMACVAILFLEDVRLDHIWERGRRHRTADNVRTFLRRRIHDIEYAVLDKHAALDRLHAAVTACPHASKAKARHTALFLRRLETLRDALQTTTRLSYCLVSDAALTVSYAFLPSTTAPGNAFVEEDCRRARHELNRLHLYLARLEIHAHACVDRIDHALSATADLPCCRRRKMLIAFLFVPLADTIQSLPQPPTLSLIPLFVPPD